MSMTTNMAVTGATVRTIARTELRRKWRAMQENEMQLVALVIAGSFFGLLVLTGIVGLFAFGSSLRDGNVGTPLESTRIVIIYAWLFITGFAAFQLHSSGIKPDHLDGMLTTVSHRELIWGIVLAYIVLFGVPALTIGFLGALAFGAGARSLVSVPLIGTLAVLLVGFGVSTGFVLILLLKNTGVRSRLVARLRTVGVIGLGAAYFWLVFTGSLQLVLDPLYRVLEVTPLGWFGDLALLGTTTEASAARAVGAVAFGSVGFLGTISVIAVLARWLWYVDPVRIDRDPSTRRLSKGSGVLTQSLPTPIAGVVRTDWIRTRRAPIALTFVLYPLFVLASPTVTVIQTGTIGSLFPPLVALCGAWVAGSMFTLNVLGNEGAALPVAVLDSGVGRALVWGHVLAGALVMVPLTVVLTAVLAFASPLSVGLAGTLTLTALVLASTAGPIGTGIGTTFPKFESTRVSRSRETILPSSFAFAGYSIALLLISLPGLLAHTPFVNAGLSSATGLSPVAIGAGGLVLTATFATAAGWLSSRRAIRTVDAFHFG